MQKIIEQGGWWWVVSGDRFRLYPFPSRTAAVEALGAEVVL